MKSEVLYSYLVCMILKKKWLSIHIEIITCSNAIIRGAYSLAPSPPSKLVNDIDKYHLYIPVYIYCTDNTVRARHASHKNDVI